MVAPLFVVGAIAAVSGAMFQVFKPRLPPYRIQIIRPPMPAFLSDGIMTKIHSNIRLHNDNFIAIDVHSLAFDLFYPTWGGELKHIGRVHDHKKQHRTEKCLEDAVCRHDKGLDDALWALQARSDFETVDDVFADLSISGVMKTIASLLYNLYQGGGSLVIPMTGVMQVKASSSTPVTMSMICDNSLNIFSFVLVGVECTMNSLDIGWLEVDETIDKLQIQVLESLVPNATGGVLESHKPRVEVTEEIEKTLKRLNKEVVA